MDIYQIILDLDLSADLKPVVLLAATVARSRYQEYQGSSEWDRSSINYKVRTLLNVLQQISLTSEDYQKLKDYILAD